MSKFTMMDTKNSEKCYMGAVMVIFWWISDKHANFIINNGTEIDLEDSVYYAYKINK